VRYNVEFHADENAGEGLHLTIVKPGQRVARARSQQAAGEYRLWTDQRACRRRSGTCNRVVQLGNAESVRLSTSLPPATSTRPSSSSGGMAYTGSVQATGGNPIDKSERIAPNLYP
jgi:hypothetical protein